MIVWLIKNIMRFSKCEVRIPWILAKFVFRVLMDGEDSVNKNLISATQQDGGVHKQGYEK